jgi:NitT/TauT family transport system permease protein
MLKASAVPEAIGESPAARRRMQLRGKFATALKSAVPILGGILVWHWASTWLTSNILFPTPMATFTEATRMALSGELLRDAGASLARIAVGFAIGSIIGIVLGLLSGYFAIARLAVGPYLQFFRFVPPIAWVSPAIIWFGIGETSKIFIIIYGTVFVVALSTIAGVTGVHKDKVRAAMMFGATHWQIFRLAIVPSTVHYSLTGMRLAMGIAFMTVVAAEMLGADSGLGYLILSSRLWMATDRIFVGIIVLGLLGLVTDRLFSLLIDRFAAKYRGYA